MGRCIIFCAAQFDRLLLRPRGLIYQMICHMIEFGRIGKIVQAVKDAGVFL